MDEKGHQLLRKGSLNKNHNNEKWTASLFFQEFVSQCSESMFR